MLRRTCLRVAVVLLSVAAAAAAETKLAESFRRLRNSGRVLVVVAHPGDEPTSAVAALARERGLRVVVFSLTRGESGAHGGAPDPRGVRRTAEALVARRLDGAEQLFGRVFDAGEAPNAAAMLARWDADAALGDVVRAVRRVRPDVMLVGSASGAASHEATVGLAREAFRAAAQPARFADGAGGGSWQATSLYEVSESGPAAIIGASGPATYFRLLESVRPGGTASGDPLDGVDTSWPGLLRTVSVSQREPLRSGLETIGLRLAAADAAAATGGAERAVPALRSALEALRHWRDRVGALPAGPVRVELAARLEEREGAIEEALARAAGLELTAVAEVPTLTAGQTFGVLVSLRNGRASACRVERLELVSGGRWGVQGGFPRGLEVAAGASVAARVLVSVAADAVPTQPYWRPEPGRGRVVLLQPAFEGAAFATPDLVARLQYVTGGIGARLEAPVLADVAGRRVPIAVVPDVTLAPTVATLTVPAGAPKPAPVEVEITAADHTARGGATRITLDLPAGWRMDPAQITVLLPGGGEPRSTRVRLTPPPRLPAGSWEIALAATRGERRWAERFDVVETQEPALRHVGERARLVVVAAPRP